jgi:aspartyl/asparaginyl beta-hydroxylase (cupin superfamily)
MKMTGEHGINLLEANWVAIREECLAVTDLTQWPEKSIYEGQWDVYGIYDLKGNLIGNHAKECPKTTEILRQIPRLQTAGFSILRAGAVIKPHIGYTDKVLRCHLGLVIPEGDCALKVEDTVYPWEEGKAFIFDDTLLHSAWNRTARDRYVLLLDFFK